MSEIFNDPIAMYLVVKTSLSMSIGKTAAQVGHACSLLVEDYFERKNYIAAIANANVSHIKIVNGKEVVDEYLEGKISIFREWLNSDYRKVVLAASDKEFEKIKSEIPDEDRVVVIDNGLTEIDPNTETVIGLYPMYKSQVPKCIKRLQLLK